MIEIIIASAIGLLCGIITGLIPGLHVNTLSAGMLAILPLLLKYFSPLSLAALIIAMATTHSFLDFIPSLLLGAPDPETALAVLPGHSLLNKGRSYHALKLTVIGGLGTFAVFLAVFPLLFWILKPMGPLLTAAIPFILIAVAVIFILRESDMRSRIWASIIFILSGVLGLLVLNHLNLKNSLFPLLSGLFGISALILALMRKSHIPEQSLKSKINYKSGRSILNYICAAVSSLVVSVMPAVGAAHAAAIAKGFRAAKNEEDYLMIVGGINTAGVLFTLVVFYLMGKTRTGAVAAMKEIITLTGSQLFVLIIISLIVAVLAAIAAMHIGKLFITRLTEINYSKVSLSIIGLVAVMVVLISGWTSLLVLLVATAIGLLAPLAGVRRVHALGCLIVPVLMWSL